MSLYINFAAASDIGLVRRSNQDSGFASSHLLVLADGVGGSAGGDIASSTTIRHFENLTGSYEASEVLPLLRSTIMSVHEELRERVAHDPSLAGLGTTCIAAYLAENTLMMTHIGDSRAYVFHEGSLVQVTHDHTLVQMLLDQGQITPEQAVNHPKRHVVVRALGDIPGLIDIDESVREAVVGDRWLLSSDGLFGFVPEEAITNVLATCADPHEACERLIGLALQAGAPDNVTVVLGDICEGEDLGAKPVAVGAAALPEFSSSGVSPSGFDVTAEESHNTADEPEELTPDDLPRPHSRLLPRIMVTLTILMLVAGSLVAGYHWTQSQYYVTIENSRVAIFQGVPYTVGSFELSHVYKITDVHAGDLQDVARERLKNPVVRHCLEDAEAFVDQLATSMATPSSSPEVSSSPSSTPSNDASQPSGDQLSDTPAGNSGGATTETSPQAGEGASGSTQGEGATP